MSVMGWRSLASSPAEPDRASRADVASLIEGTCRAAEAATCSKVVATASSSASRARPSAWRTASVVASTRCTVPATRAPSVASRTSSASENEWWSCQARPTTPNAVPVMSRRGTAAAERMCRARASASRSGWARWYPSTSVDRHRPGRTHGLGRRPVGVERHELRVTGAAQERAVDEGDADVVGGGDLGGRGAEEPDDLLAGAHGRQLPTEVGESEGPGALLVEAGGKRRRGPLGPAQAGDRQRQRHRSQHGAEGHHDCRPPRRRGVLVGAHLELAAADGDRRPRAAVEVADDAVTVVEHRDLGGRVDPLAGCVDDVVDAERAGDVADDLARRRCAARSR